MIARNQDITGMRFGKLIVIERDIQYEKEHNTNSSYWKCQCDCGNIKTIRRASLINGVTQSCGCLRANDLTNQRFGRLVVLKRVDNRNKKVCWLCQCDCGNQVVVDAGSLKSGNTKSCGCLRQESCKNINYKDLTNQKFGKLLALEPIEQRATNNHILWKCKCDCGNIVPVDSSSLISGHTTSCGCSRISHGEEKLAQLLINNKISYVYNQGYFKDLVSERGRVLRFDFIVFNEEGVPIRLIEFDGEQHIKPIAYFGGEEHLIQTQKNDQIKNQYAIEHKIPLIRIPYNALNTFTYEDIWSEKFLIKE